MRRSLRYRLFISLCLLIVFFVLLSWLLNSQLLERYYMEQKKNVLLKSSAMIDKIYDGKPENIALELERIENTIGCSIVIHDKEGTVKYTTFTRAGLHGPQGGMSGALPGMGMGMGRDRERPWNAAELLKHKEATGEKYLFDIIGDMEIKVEFLNLHALLHNGDVLVIRAPLAAISESAATANRFMLFTGILVLILGSIWALIFSRSFTRPILELNRVTQSMAGLDFSRKCSIAASDELGELARNINNLSDRLDSAISKLNEKNQSLMEDIERERKLEELRKEFVSSVSHELKTPVSLIQGYAEGLRENITEDEESKDFYCEVIIDEAQKMDKLVKDLLNLSHIESGFFQLERTSFDISELLNQVLGKYRGVFEEKGVLPKLEGIENVLVNADKVRIEQILVNFINNAINHVNEQKNITITMKEKAETVRISIFNSGKHIPQEYMDKIWTSFYKIDKARTREYGGTGLGLSIVRAIQEQHNGAYGVENLEAGISFWFELHKQPEIINESI